MIKLELPPKPEKLTDELQKKLTEDFKINKNARMWDIKWLKDVLLEMSWGKCAFSETKLQEEGKYMQVEHFYPKSLYPNMVMEWGNLFPISNICNRKKWDIDPNQYPLVNPVVDNPKDYFYISNGRLFGRNETDKAINTIDIYGLNDDKLRKPRYRIEQEIQSILDLLALPQTDIVRCIKGLKALMRNSSRIEAYSATKSTYILQSSIYQMLKLHLISEGLWDSEFVSLEKELEFCSLPK